MKILFTGHRTFGNRGCEAIVRSTVTTIREIHKDTTFLVPSTDINRDQHQWPSAADFGVEFIPTYGPWYDRYWVHSQRLPIPFLKRSGWPFPFPGWVRDIVDSVDAVLSIGGDNYSLDYRIPSLLIGMDQLARDLNKPNILWGASVGPFGQEPAFLPKIKRHLAGFDTIAVRESVSKTYLEKTLGLSNVIKMVDPAFGLKKEPIDTEAFWPTGSSNGVLGLNVSPLIERYKREGQDLRAEVIAFIRKAVAEYGLNVLLIPHVIPLNGVSKNNDAHYMAPILDATTDLGNSVTMTPTNLNAAEIKGVISKLRFFIGARTHATIAALSTGVPTISIAYSVKARGINRDLFGHEDVVLPTASLKASVLLDKLNYLKDEESTLKAQLAGRLPEYRDILAQAYERVLNIKAVQAERT